MKIKLSLMILLSYYFFKKKKILQCKKINIKLSIASNYLFKKKYLNNIYIKYK